jgi:hypothetical protein
MQPCSFMLDPLQVTSIRGTEGPGPGACGNGVSTSADTGPLQQSAGKQRGVESIA